MKRNHSIAIVSTSALAAGMAQGAVTYSGLLNTQLFCPENTAVPPAEIDMNWDFATDFKVGFDGIGSSNWRKPFVDSRFLPSAALTQPDMGVPVTPFGTMIDATYLAPSTNNTGYLSQNGDGNLVGDWPQTVATEGYVGVQLTDAFNTVTNFGWIHLIYNAAANPPYLTLVDWGYESTPGLGIPAGSTNTLGAPQIYAAPQSQTVPLGATVEMKVLALGEPAPAYQWRAGPAGSGTFTNLIDGGNISGATTATLTINGAGGANAGDYVVALSNTAGSVTSSPPARLTIVAPVITPAARTLFAGLTAEFDVTVGAGLSPTFQWRKNGSNLSDGANISGATTANLRVSNLSSGDAGNYDVLVTVGTSAIASTPASLAVVQAEGAYERALLSAGPVAYYRLNESGNPGAGSVVAWDNAGAFNGIYGTEVTNASAGIAGPRPSDGFPGFSANNGAALFTTNLADSRITLAPWKLNTDTLTMTAWLNPLADQSPSAGVIYTISSNKMIAGLHYYYQLNSGTGRVSIGYNWRDEWDFFWDPGISPPDAQWSFVALVIQPTNAMIYMFNTAGFVGATNVTDPARVPLPFNAPEHIGTDATSTSGTQNFNGVIDEVAIFKKALTLEQIQMIYDGALGNAPVTLQALRTGETIQLTWEQGQLLEAPDLTGPWTTNSTATSPYPVTPTGPRKFYRVLVR